MLNMLIFTKLKNNDNDFVIYDVERTFVLINLYEIYYTLHV